MGKGKLEELEELEELKEDIKNKYEENFKKL